MKIRIKWSMEVKNIQDIRDLINEFSEERKSSIRELEKKSGLSIGIISRWPKEKTGPKLDSVLEVLGNLKIKMKVKSPEEEWTISNTKLSFQYIEMVIKKSDFTISELEEKINVSNGLISRCRRINYIKFSMLLDIIKFFNHKMIVEYEKVEYEKVEYDKVEVKEFVEEYIKTTTDEERIRLIRLIANAINLK